MSEVLIDIQNISKKFSRSYKSSALKGLKKAFRSLFGVSQKFDEKLYEKEFYALKDITFQVSRGECVGFLGHNGAGKSTILKHISGIYLPDLGEIKVTGHIEGLIELGAGFHPILSGRDNLWQRCAMLGLDRKETLKMIDDIIEFSELEEFIDMPVQNYSSGMAARLGFSSAVLTKPDVLLVDEVLSVGDFEFRQKCLAKINEIKKDAAVIFVGHSAQMMKMFCDRGIILDKGEKLYDGGIDEAVDLYLSQFGKNANEEQINSFFEKYVDGDAGHPIFGEQIKESGLLKSIEYFWGDKKGVKKSTFQKGEEINLYIDLEFISELEEDSTVFIGVPIWHKDKETYLTAFNSDKYKIFLKEKKSFKIKLSFPNVFNHGDYIACIAIQDGLNYFVRKIVSPFSVLGTEVRDHGLIRLQENWNIE